MLDRFQVIVRGEIVIWPHSLNKTLSPLSNDRRPIFDSNNTVILTGGDDGQLRPQMTYLTSMAPLQSMFSPIGLLSPRLEFVPGSHLSALMHGLPYLIIHINI